ncbi:MAG: hypothetical protein RLO11_12780 [Salinisphaeraceae bacterium]
MKAATLSGQLLARKGDAQPALAPARDAISRLVGSAPASQAPAPQPVVTETLDRGVARIVRPSPARVVDTPAVCEAAPSVTPLRAAAADRETETGGGGPGARESVRLSVRMGRERHRKLRILAAQRGISLQQAMIQAIDGLVSTASGEPDTRNCPCLGSADLKP